MRAKTIHQKADDATGFNVPVLHDLFGHAEVGISVVSDKEKLVEDVRQALLRAHAACGSHSKEIKLGDMGAFRQQLKIQLSRVEGPKQKLVVMLRDLQGFALSDKQHEQAFVAKGFYVVGEF